VKTEEETREARNKDSERGEKRGAWPAQVREAATDEALFISVMNAEKVPRNSGSNLSGYLRFRDEIELDFDIANQLSLGVRHSRQISAAMRPPFLSRRWE
jgi:hypothetical protein